MDWIDIDEAVSYILEILDDRVLPLQDVLHEIRHAPTPLKWLQNLEHLEEFLQSYEDGFIVENGKVAVYDPAMEAGREGAVAYFESQLNMYNERPHYWNFRGHLGQAEAEVIDFINYFYPKKEFKQFLLAHSDVFIVFNDDTVFLKEKVCVNYFKKRLEQAGEGLYFMNLRGRIGQAPNYVIKYIKTYYPGESFLEFLENNSNVFNIDDGYVYLNENDDND